MDVVRRLAEPLHEQPDDRRLPGGEAVPGRAGEQVSGSDRPVGFDCVVESAVPLTQHSRSGQLREQPGDRGVQVEATVVNQGHGERSGQWLGDRRPAED